MASLLPLIHDILPMIMPSSIHITKASDLLPTATLSNEEGDLEAASGVKIIKRDAIINKSDKICASGRSRSQGASDVSHKPRCEPPLFKLG